jgi:hypothetical protein
MRTINMAARQRHDGMTAFRQRCLAWTGALVLILGGAAGAPARGMDQEATVVDEGLRELGVGHGPATTALIVAWNELAGDIAFGEDQFLTFKGHRALAMMHLAMHDALNTVVPIYRRYAYDGPRVAAHPAAAAAQGAHDVLLSQYPGQNARLTAELSLWLGKVPNGKPRDRGIELGRAAAAAILAVRANDRYDFPGAYKFRDGAGQYQTTPPWNGFVAQPGFRFAAPFTLDSPHHFRPAPPPPLRSATYAQAFGEVKEYGAVDSTSRTEDQTAYAVWWMEFAEGSVNRLARQLAPDRGLHPWTAARLFAQVGMALFDTYVAVWDSKYTYNHWRPYTAVREAGADDNARTTPDPAWEPLRPTPPTPDYVSAHAAACAASFGILEEAMGRTVAFTMETTTAPPGMPTRAFQNFRAAAAECADSRVRLGWHYRYATDAGLALGRRVAKHTAEHTLRRLARR